MPSTWALPRARQLQLSCACVPWARARAPYVYCTGLQTLAGGIYVCLRVCALGPRALFPSPLRSGRPSNWNPRRKESPSSWVRARALSLSRAIRVQIPATVGHRRSSAGLAFCALERRSRFLCAFSERIPAGPSLFWRYPAIRVQILPVVAFASLFVRSCDPCSARAESATRSQSRQNNSLWPRSHKPRSIPMFKISVRAKICKLVRYPERTQHRRTR